jgi:hypothetical protein
MFQLSTMDQNAGLYTSAMPMIRNRASHSRIDLDELEAYLTEATTDVYVYKVYGDLTKYEQAWKIDKLVWDKFCRGSWSNTRVRLTRISSA